MPVYNPAITIISPSIGTTVTGATEGSVFFAGAAGVLAQDNANFFWHDTDNSLILAATPPASATKASLRLGTALSGGDVDGTYLGINAGSGFAGDLFHFQVNNSSKARLFADGSLTLGSNADLYRLTITGPSKGGAFLGISTNAAVDSDALLFLTVANVVTGTIMGMNLNASCTTDLTALVNNTNSTSSARAIFESRVAGAGAGDPLYLFTINGVRNWVAGIDNSDSDTFKIAHQGSLGEADADFFMIDIAGKHTLTSVDAGTSAVIQGLTLRYNSSGTPTAGFGNELRWKLKSSITDNRDAAAWRALWETETDASRKADMVGVVWDTAEREWIRGRANGSAPEIAVLAGTPQGVQTVNAAATDLATVIALTNQIRAAFIGFGYLV